MEMIGSYNKLKNICLHVSLKSHNIYSILSRYTIIYVYSHNLNILIIFFLWFIIITNYVYILTFKIIKIATKKKRFTNFKQSICQKTCLLKNHSLKIVLSMTVFAVKTHLNI